MLQVRPIDAQTCLPLRQQVLWPTLSLAACQLPEDAAGLHFGGYLDAQLVCVASFFVQPDRRARLRKFATALDHQRRGIGRALLLEACAELQRRGVTHLWFDARRSAQPFYQRLGFAADGAPFIKRDVEYLRMHGSLADIVAPTAL